MATYEQVVASYYYPPGSDTRVVLHTNKIDRELGISALAIWRSLDNIITQTKRARDQTEAQQMLWQATERSRLGVEGLKRLAGSQINPFFIHDRNVDTIAKQAYRLHMGRLLCEALLEEKLPVAEPVNAALLEDFYRPDLVPAFRSLDGVLRPLVFGSHTAADQTAAEQTVSAYGFDEASIATIALKELEPERVLTQMADGEDKNFVEDCSLLMSARYISRSMHTLQ